MTANRTRGPMKRGRPVTNLRLHEIIRERKCSRPTAYKILKFEKAMARATRITPAEWASLEKAGVVIKEQQCK